jgi:hypothetical protein
MNYKEEEEPEYEYTSTQNAAEYLEELRKLSGNFAVGRAKEKPAKLSTQRCPTARQVKP